MINCLIVEDEPIARRGLLEHIEQIDFLNPVAECKNAIEAGKLLHGHQVDLIFLDIQMPRMSGIDFLKGLPNPPAIILTTAFSEYALTGYDLNVLDYLLKPIHFERFFKAVLKAQFYLNSLAKSVSEDGKPYFFIKSSHKIEKIVTAEVIYIEAMANYVIIHTTSRKHVAYISFKSIEALLPSKQFMKIHKSFIVALCAVQSIDNNKITLINQTLPIGNSYKFAVMNRIEHDLYKR
ncbi:response regulator transcription factor [Hymenobacter sp. RP-2-7]|uniref:Response regulator transcription factor n=1 Tax=Hymenobacter polaris TaxID=2682546 RepID=A0A7Y0ABM0_9BACT|nr:LytTR family DNA-binding domain-containing protein [Hymenobacter polaris]NML64187.1 response regulator transcription factor [Hymenobacter polaris]